MTIAEHIDLLLVDDDEDFRTVAARNFRKRGFELQEAADGEQA